MKTIAQKILKLTPALIAIIAIGFFGVDMANAQNTVASQAANLFGLNMWDFISQGTAQLFFQFQTMASWLIILAGYLLNFSINLTLNIKEFVDNTPAIFTTWKALRDITGMFIIFALLYAAIQLITGLKSAKFGELIKDIVIAGVLINFSFFFAGLGIDASNMVSVQLYNAIAPASSLSVNNISVNKINSIAEHGGLSDIFMSSLKIPSLYDVTGQRTSAGEATGGGTWAQPFNIMLYGFTSIMIMVTAAFSFGIAALMFIVRFVLLLFLLAFSPIWFASFVIPQIKDYAGKWIGYYKSMLLIMPVYLLLMYMSLNVLTSQNFFGNIGPGTESSVTAGTNPTGLVENAYAQNSSTNTKGSTPFDNIISLAVNAVLVIFMMNVPLVGAISVGGGAIKFLNAENFGAGAIWKKVGSYTGRNTLGAGANALSESRTFKRIAAASPEAGLMISKQLSKVSSSGFGGGKKGSYDSVLKADKKAREELYKKVGSVDESRYTSDTERKAAKDFAKSMQSRTLENMSASSIFNLMMKNRGGVQAAYEIQEKAKKKELASQEKQIKKDKSEMESLISQKKIEIENNRKRVGFSPVKEPTSEQLEEIAKLEKEVSDLDKKLEEIEEYKEEQKADKLAGKVSEKTKKDDEKDEKPKKDDDSKKS